jgi:chemotaxis protein MotD
LIHQRFLKGLAGLMIAHPQAATGESIVPSVASEPPPHALNASSPHPRRNAHVAERGQTSPFESLLEDSAQTAPERPAQAIPEDERPRSEPPDPSNPPVHSQSTRPSKAAKPADKVQFAAIGKPVNPDQNSESPGDAFQFPIDVKAVAKPTKSDIAAGEDTAVDEKPDSDKPADGKPADLAQVDVGADIGEPADIPVPDNLGAVVSDLAKSHINTVAAGVTGPALAPAKPEPAPQAIAHAVPFAPVENTGPQIAQAAPKAETADGRPPEDQATDIAVPQIDPEISDKDKVPQVKVAPAAKENGKPEVTNQNIQKIDRQDDGQAALQSARQSDTAEKLTDNPTDLTNDKSDTPRTAHPRIEALANAHRGAPAETARPINTDAQFIAPKPGTDITLPHSFSATSHVAPPPAVNAPAAPPAQPRVQAAPVPLAGIALEIAGKALAGKNRFEIRLDPPELGRIDVRLDVDRDGNVTSRLIVDRADTLDLLRRDAAGLERALQDAGLKTADNGMQFSLRDQTTGQEQQQSGLEVAQLVVRDENVVANDAIGREYYRRIGPSGGLDIRV